MRALRKALEGHRRQLGPVTFNHVPGRTLRDDRYQLLKGIKVLKLRRYLNTPQGSVYHQVWILLLLPCIWEAQRARGLVGADGSSWRSSRATGT